MTDGLVDWRIRRVALLSTGSEILQGQYADSNARFLAEKLTLAGLEVVSITAAPDNAAAVKRAINFSAAGAELIVCTGGLGPTDDDVNRWVFENAFKVALKRDEKAVEQMGRRFLTRGRGPMPEANEVQALLPEGCIPFYNKWGTAPGFFLPPTGKGELGHCGLMALPGPPTEMIPMFETLAMPLLKNYVGGERLGAIRTIHTFGHPESHVGTLVAELFTPTPGVEFTILAKRHGVDLRICATGADASVVNARLDAYEKRVRSKLHAEMIYGVDDDTLAVAVGRLLKKKQAWVTTAESCTGGMVAQMLTDVAGSSAYVGECHVTYSNSAKVRVLGVSQETLDLHGAVSEQVAVEMAQGVRRGSGADYAVSITGIAGPDGGSDEKPVGLTYIGLAGPADTSVSRHVFMGNREHNRLQAAQTALNLLRLMLLKR